MQHVASPPAPVSDQNVCASPRRTAVGPKLSAQIQDTKFDPNPSDSLVSDTFIRTVGRRPLTFTEFTWFLSLKNVTPGGNLDTPVKVTRKRITLVVLTLGVGSTERIAAL